MSADLSEQNGAYGIVTGHGTIRFERLLPGPIERVWAFLFEPEKRRLWFGGGAMSSIAGDDIELIFNNSQLTENDEPPPPRNEPYNKEIHMHGRMLAFNPPSLLAFTFGESNDQYSEVRFDLATVDQNVRMILTHTKLESREALLSVAAGWHTHVGILIDLLNGRTTPGFWKTHTRLEAEYSPRIPGER